MGKSAGFLPEKSDNNVYNSVCCRDFAKIVKLLKKTFKEILENKHIRGDHQKHIPRWTGPSCSFFDIFSSFLKV